MENKTIILKEDDIRNKIYTVRGLQVMLDSDLAELYDIDTAILNQTVKRNRGRFPTNFMFQLTEQEYQNLISQIVISSSKWGGRRNLPYAFTEQGVAMLSGVLKSEVAVKISIQIVNAFVAMKKFISSNAEIFLRLDKVEMSEIAIKNKISEHDQKIKFFDIKQIEHDKKLIEYNQNFEKIFDAIQSKDIKPEKGIFFDGQIFDAYKFVSDLIRSAEKSIVLIDNYIDDSVLTLFTKRKENVKVTVFTKNISKELLLDLEKYNSQYPVIEVKEFKQSHDRFLIIDNKEVYHFGASLKDLGKKWFAFSKFDKEAAEMLIKLK